MKFLVLGNVVVIKIMLIFIFKVLRVNSFLILLKLDLGLILLKLELGLIF